MKWETDGLVLKVTDVGESDRVLTVLTRDNGVLHAFANGAKKIKSGAQSATGTLCYSRFSIYQSRDSYIIDDAKCIESFFRLREDIEKLSLAQYFCELACELAPELDEASDFLRLVLNCLHFLVTGKRSQLFLKCVAEIRMLTLSGYMPELLECSKCGSEPQGGAKFSPAEGKIYCSGCYGGGFAVSDGVLAAMRHICHSPDERLFSFTLPDSSLASLSKISEAYLHSQVHRNFKALDFYNRLMTQ